MRCCKGHRYGFTTLLSGCPPFLQSSLVLVFVFLFQFLFFFELLAFVSVVSTFLLSFYQSFASADKNCNPVGQQT